MLQTTVKLNLTEANLQRVRLAAEMEHRSLSNFVTHVVLAYLNEGKNNDK